MERLQSKWLIRWILLSPGVLPQVQQQESGPGLVKPLQTLSSPDHSLDSPSQPVVTVGFGSLSLQERAWSGWGTYAKMVALPTVLLWRVASPTPEAQAKTSFFHSWILLSQNTATNYCARDTVLWYKWAQTETSHQWNSETAGSCCTYCCRETISQPCGDSLEGPISSWLASPWDLVYPWSYSVVFWWNQALFVSPSISLQIAELIFKEASFHGWSDSILSVVFRHRND